MKPKEIFKDFFSLHELTETREQIELLVKIALTTNSGYYTESAERSDLFLLKEGLLECINAAYILQASRI